MDNKYLKYKQKYLYLKNMKGGTLQEDLSSNIYGDDNIVLHYIMNGILTAVKPNNKIHEFNLPDDLVRFLDSNPIRISDKLSAANIASGGDSYELRDQVRELTTAGVITEENNGTYRGRGAIHNIGNLVEERYLLSEANAGLLSWYFNYFNYVKNTAQINSIFTISPRDRTDFEGMSNEQIYTYKLIFTSSMDPEKSILTFNLYKLLKNIIKKIDPVLKGLKSNDEYKEMIKEDTLKKWKDNPSDGFGRLESLENDQIVKYIKKWLELRGQDKELYMIILGFIRIEMECYIYVIKKYFDCYINNFQNAIQYILSNNQLQRLAIAYHRLKIVDEKYQSIHALDDEDKITKRGWSLEHKRRVQSDDAYSKNFNINLGRYGRLLDHIQSMIINIIQTKLDIFNRYCM